MIKFSDEIAEGDVIAVGDIHATWGPFEEFLQWVKGSLATVILLGDLIDRGGEDLKVLEATRDLMVDPDSWGLQSLHVIRGNHEEMFLKASTNTPYQYQEQLLWFKNGGNDRDFDEMVSSHREWISKTPLYMTVGSTMFIHAGIVPGYDPETTLGCGFQGLEKLLWMREPFLREGPKFKQWNPNLKHIVHGHTPTLFEDCNKELEREEDFFLPVVQGERINIDTGAFTPKGRLTVYNATTGTFKQFHKS